MLTHPKARKGASRLFISAEYLENWARTAAGRDDKKELVFAEWLAGPVHALALHTYTPEEWKETLAAPDSPDCRGGTGK